MLGQAIGVIGAVGDDGLGPYALKQSRDSAYVVVLAWDDGESHRPSKAIAGHVNLGGQSALGTPNSRIEAPFFDRSPGLGSPAGGP